MINVQIYLTEQGQENLGRRILEGYAEWNEVRSGPCFILYLEDDKKAQCMLLTSDQIAAVWCGTTVEEKLAETS